MLPRWLVRFLEVALPPQDAEPWIGDLEEVHGRRRARWGTRPALLLSIAEGLWMAVRWLPRRVASGMGDGLRGVSGAELRLALRLVVKQPVMTLTSVLALGVGIGIVAGSFSLFHQILSSELDWANGDRWVTVEAYRADTGRRSGMGREHLSALRSEAPAFAYVGVARSGEYNVLHEGGEVERVAGARITPGTFRHLPYRPLVGRLMGAGDGTAGADPVALIRESYWQRRFGEAPDVMERTLMVAEVAHRIVGVLPDDAGYPADGELWLSLPEDVLASTATLGATGAPRSETTERRLVGVLAPDATPAVAGEQAQRLADGLAGSGNDEEPLALRVIPLGDTLNGPNAQLGFLVVVGVLLAVLLIIAANVANLVVARTSRRAPELAVRTALGASRRRIVGQLFVEMLVIGGLASALGLPLAAGLLRIYDGALDELPFWVELSLEPSTALVVALLALLVAGVTGVLPALRATGKAPGDQLRGAGRGASLRVGRVGGAMIAAEVALSVALLGASTLFALGYQRYLQPAFDLPEDRVLTARLTLDLTDADLPEGGASTPADSSAALLDGLRARVAELPGVEAVTLVSHLPRTSPWPEPLELEGRPELLPTPLVFVAEDFLEVLEVEPVLGRGITAGDRRPGAPAVAVVNRAFAEEHFGTLQVLGRRLRMAPRRGAEPEAWREIVGVVPNLVEVADATGGTGVYVPLATRRFVSLAARTNGLSQTLAPALRRVAYDLDPELDLYSVVPLREVGAENRRALGAMTAGLLGVGLVTLLLSLAGVYSLVSLAVTRRTREIGVRVALGARAEEIRALVFRQGIGVVAGGVVLGLVAAFGLSRLMASILFEVSTSDPVSFLLAPVVLVAVALLATWLPARRAARVDPLEALRAE